tara:strand:+ start:149 stop:427 length:279 start_codon:yes stop_codon:yes gene_type:complete
MANRFMIIKMVRIMLLLVKGSFSAFNNNNIGNTGGIRFAAKWEPQKRKANRLKRILSDKYIDCFVKPNIDDIIDGKIDSVIPRIDIIEHAIK